MLQRFSGPSHYKYVLLLLLLLWCWHTTMVEINYWTSCKICAKVAFPSYTESVKFRSQSRETASKRKPYRGLGTR